MKGAVNKTGEKDVLFRIKDHLTRHAEWWLLALGVVLRLKHFFENRSLWLDESWVAVSTVSRSFLETFSHRQIMPEFPQPSMGFFLFEKIAVMIFGNNEMALRLFPFLFGLTALAVFSIFFRRFLCRRDFLVALGLFAIAEPLVYYSAEVKQYSLDLLVTLLLFWFSDHLLNCKTWTLRKIALVAVIGISVIWISYAACIVLIGLSLLFAFRFSFGKNWRALKTFGIVVLSWLASFALLYKVALSVMDRNSALKGIWKGVMLNQPSEDFGILGWLGNIVNESFRDPVGLGWPILGWILFLLGVFSFFQKDRWRTFLFLSPIIFTLIAAILGKYPFSGRMLLFLIPSYYFFIVCGAGFLVDKTQRLGGIILLIMLVLIFFSPVKEALAKFFQGRSQSDNRQMCGFLRDRYEPGDNIFMNTSAQPPFWYYAGSLGLGEMIPQEIVGVFEGNLLKAARIGKFARFMGDKDGKKFIAFRDEYNNFDKKGLFQGTYGFTKKAGPNLVYVGEYYDYQETGRTWLFLSAGDAYDNEINTLILNSFDRRAKRLLFRKGKNAGVYLYDMSVKPLEQKIVDLFRK